MVGIQKISGEVDGAGSVAHELDVTQNLTTTGAKLWVVENAGTEVFSVDKDGIATGEYVTVVKPSAGGQGIEDAINDAKTAGGGIVQLLAGTYNVTDAIFVNDLNNVILQGVGESTVLAADTTVAFPSGAFVYRVTTGFGVINKPLNNTTNSDTSIFTTTPGDAGSILKGMVILVEGTDSDGIKDQEYHEAAADGNPSNGEIQLTHPITKTMTSANLLRAFRNGKNNAIKDLKIKRIAGTNPITGIWMQEQVNCIYENVIIENMDLGNQHSFTLDSCWGGTINGCISRNSDSIGIQGGGLQSVIIENCTVETASIGSAANASIRLINNCSDCIVRNNTCKDNRGNGIQLFSNGPQMRRISVYGNTIQKGKSNGVYVIGSNTIVGMSEIVITNNSIDRVEGSGVRVESCSRAIVSNNRIKESLVGITYGIYLQDPDNIIVIGNSIENVTRDGIISFKAATASTDGHIMSDNRVKSPALRGIIPAQGELVVVKGNHIDGSVNDGIQFSTMLKSIAASNIIVNTTGDGIQINNDCSDNLIMGNLTNGDGVNQGTGSNTFVSNIN